LSIGLALQDPEVNVGYKKLAKIISEEFSVNSFLCHLVQRALVHKQNPLIGRLEAEEMELFISGCQSFKQLITSCQAVIN
jgi:hypothetical protein